MYRYIETLYRSRPGVVIVSSDQADAYSHVDRRGAIAAGSECCLEVEWCFVLSFPRKAIMYCRDSKASSSFVKTTALTKDVT